MWKALLSSLLLATSPDGWVPVERAQTQEVARNLDPLIWPVFSVALGEEKALVRFPVDPTYRYLPDGGLVVEAVSAGEIYLLEVKAQGGMPHASTAQWRDESGAAIQERFVQTDEHLYHLTLISPMERPDHFERFVESLDVEPCKK